MRAWSLTINRGQTQQRENNEFVAHLKQEQSLKIITNLFEKSSFKWQALKSKSSPDQHICTKQTSDFKLNWYVPKCNQYNCDVHP